MKKIRYSTGVKAVVALLHEICLVVLVISIFLMTTLINRNMLEFPEFKSQKFSESKSYQEIFKCTVAEILNYVKYQKQFEKDNEYDPKKSINIMLYMEDRLDTSNARLNGKNGPGFCYYLGDLEYWSKEYVRYPAELRSFLYISEDGELHQLQQLFESENKIWESDTVLESFDKLNEVLQELLVSEITYKIGLDVGNTTETAILQKVKDGRIYHLKGDELKEILVGMNLADVKVNKEIFTIEEKYLPIERNSIFEEFLAGNITFSEMEKLYFHLEYTLQNIGSEITSYKQLVNKYENGSSNLQFLIYSQEDNQTYANISLEIMQDLLAYGKRLGSYFYYNVQDIHLDTNVDTMEDFFYESLESGLDGHTSIIFVGVDTEFPNKDSFWQAKEEYEKIHPWILGGFIASILSAIGTFFAFIYLSLAAGRRSADDEVHLNCLDRIKTEIWIVGFCMICFAIIGTYIRLSQLFYETNIVNIMIMAGSLTFVESAILMIFYMGFVRRLRTKIMWSGSILFWLYRGIQKLISNWKPSVKMLVAFSIHILITFIMVGLEIWVWKDNIFYSILLSFAYFLLCGIEIFIFLREGLQRNVIIDGIKRIAAGDLTYKINTDLLKGDNKTMGEAINTIGEGLYHAVADSTKNERLKADLITNVSHDIKTPLTSIINYVDLLKREDLENERIRGYIDVLDTKSQRLKQLTEDLVEASKISSGNITLQMNRLNFVELVYQTAGEFNEKFEDKGLTAVTKMPNEPVMILADGRRIWRVIENLYNNVAKYALENTRVYVDMEIHGDVVEFSIKNISKHPLNIAANELTERFIRGDVSRSTEGSGLGLFIAKDLTKLMGGIFDIYLDGDLFKVTVTFLIDKEEDL